VKARGIHSAIGTAYVRTLKQKEFGMLEELKARETEKNERHWQGWGLVATFHPVGPKTVGFYL
jgi:hypothetical protein